MIVRLARAAYYYTYRVLPSAGGSLSPVHPRPAPRRTINGPERRAAVLTVRSPDLRKVTELGREKRKEQDGEL